jgi:hypothetical protein
MLDSELTIFNQLTITDLEKQFSPVSNTTPITTRVVRPYVTHVLCHTVSVNSHEIHAPSLGSGASVGGGEVEVVSRGSGSGSVYDQWKLSVKSENHTPSPAKRRSSKRPPNLTNLGRASDETVVLHMAKYRSRTLRVTAKRLSNVQGQT